MTTTFFTNSKLHARAKYLAKRLSRTGYVRYFESGTQQRRFHVAWT
jgi:hypothetical protein